jgi:hypothetical protein
VSALLKMSRPWFRLKRLSEIPCRYITGTLIRTPRSTNATGLCSWNTESRSGTPGTGSPRTVPSGH